MRWRPFEILLALGAVVLIAAAVVLLVAPQGHRAAPPPAAPTVTTQPAPAPPAPPPPPPKVAPMSWRSAGAIVWHSTDVDPTVFGQALRAAGFGWAAVLLADGTGNSAPSPQWADLFRAASGLPIGGWSVLRDHPVEEARLAASLIAQDHLDFFVANAEQEYAYTDGADRSPLRYSRSREFVTAFRAAEPSLPAALSSYCLAGEHDLDWKSWARGHFEFLPQAYVPQLGVDGDPADCVSSARPFFPAAYVHPTLAVFGGKFATPSPEAYGALLASAGTVGFSLFPGETATNELPAFGQAIAARQIAAVPQP